VCTLRDVCRRDSGESYTCARPTGQRGLRTPAFGADTVTGREEPVRHVVRGPFGFLGPRPARPAVNIHSFIHGPDRIYKMAPRSDADSFSELSERRGVRGAEPTVPDLLQPKVPTRYFLIIVIVAQQSELNRGRERHRAL
jgi:hypothetical protein